MPRHHIRSGRLRSVAHVFGDVLQADHAEKVHQQLGIATGAIHFAFSKQNRIRPHQRIELLPHFGENHQLGRTLQVFQRCKSHLIAIARVQLAHLGDDARHCYLFAVSHAGQVSRIMRDLLLDQGHIYCQWVIGYIKADQLLFPLQIFARIGQHSFRQAQVFRYPRLAAKDAQLPTFRCAEMAAANRDHRFHHLQQRIARTESIQRANLDHELKRALADLLQIHALHKVVHALELALSARPADKINRLLPHIFDRPQPKADGRGLIGEVFNGEIPLT